MKSIAILLPALFLFSCSLTPSASSSEFTGTSLESLQESTSSSEESTGHSSEEETSLSEEFLSVSKLESSDIQSSESSSSEEEEPELEPTVIQQHYVDLFDRSPNGLDCCPSFGELHPLVIPVWFTDSSNYITGRHKYSVLEDIEAAYFGTQEDTGWHSVKTFYEEESFGNLTIVGNIYDWYECGRPSSDYSAGNTPSLVQDAVEWYFSSESNEPRSYFDMDEDGYLDAVLLIYGSPDYISLYDENRSNLWAYCSWLCDENLKNPANPGPNTFFWASYDFLYSPGWDAQMKTGSYYGAGDTGHCTLDAHTYIHEMGHVFGLDDYYDYGEYGYKPAGAFSMQDHNVGGHDPYSLMALGWVEPYIPNVDCSITIRPFVDSHDLILLTPEWNEFDSPFDEYLLLEFYTPTGTNEQDSRYEYAGYPRGPRKNGIRVWHVDARLAYSNETTLYGYSEYPQFENDFTSDVYHPCRYGLTTAFDNSFGEGYGSVVEGQSEYINLLQLIRNNTSQPMQTNKNLSSDDLFLDGDTFSMLDYQSQFVNGRQERMNSGTPFGWNFSVTIDEEGDEPIAIIDVYQA